MGDCKSIRIIIFLAFWPFFCSGVISQRTDFSPLSVDPFVRIFHIRQYISATSRSRTRWCGAQALSGQPEGLIFHIRQYISATHSLHTGVDAPPDVAPVDPARGKVRTELALTRYSMCKERGEKEGNKERFPPLPRPTHSLFLSACLLHPFSPQEATAQSLVAALTRRLAGPCVSREAAAAAMAAAAASLPNVTGGLGRSEPRAASAAGRHRCSTNSPSAPATAAIPDPRREGEEEERKEGPNEQRAPEEHTIHEHWAKSQEEEEHAAEALIAMLRWGGCS